MPDPLVRVEPKQDGVVVVRLCRDEKLNALSEELCEQYLAALASDAVRASRAVVVTGSQRAFSVESSISVRAARPVPHVGTTAARSATAAAYDVAPWDAKL